MKTAIQISVLAGLLALAACDSPPENTPAGTSSPTGTAPGTLALHPLDPPAGPGAMAPRFSTHQDEILLTWLQPVPDSPGTDALLFSRLEGQGTAAHWTEPVEIVRGEEFFTNWADNPGIRRGEDGTLVAYWLARSGPNTYAYDVRLARSLDHGRSWSTAGVLHHDGVAGEHGFVSSVSEPSGMRAFWLDGREMSMEGDGGHEGSGNMTLRTAVVDENAGADQLLDERVCECCQTAAGMTAGGPVNGPSLAVRPGHENELVVAWYTAADARPRVQASFSSDGGASFDAPILLNEHDPLGRVDVAWDGNGGVVVLWLSPRGEEGEADLLLRRVSTGGTAGDIFQVAATSTSRSSGFPRLVRRGEEMFLVWTLPAGDSTELHAASLPLSSLPGWSARQAKLTAGDGNRSTPVATAGPDARPWDGAAGSRAPEYSALTLDREQISLADLRGRPVLVNFWATWCLPCRQEAPALIGIHERYSPSGLQVVGVSVDTAGDEEEVRRFLATEGVPYRTLLDPEDQATGTFGLSMLPGSFLFDENGVLVWSRLGIVTPGDAELTAALDTL